MSATYISPASLPHLRPVAGERPADDASAPYRDLAAAVLRQAVCDLRDGSRLCARQVLAGGCAPWLDLLWLDEGMAAAVDARLRSLAQALS